MSHDFISGFIVKGTGVLFVFDTYVDTSVYTCCMLVGS